MKKILGKIFIALVSIIGALFFLSLLFVLTLQTKWGQEKAKTALIQLASNNNIELKIKDLKGALPFTFILEGLEINAYQNSAKVEKLSFSLSLTALLKKELSLINLKAKNIFVTLKENTSFSPNAKASSSFPINLSLASFNLKDIHLKNTVFSLSGGAAIKKDLKNIHLNLTLRKKEFKNSYIKLFADKKEETIAASLKTKASLKFFEMFINKSFNQDLPLSFEISSQTSWKNLLDFIYSKEKVSSIKGKAKGSLLPLEHIDPLLFVFDFDIFSDFSLDIAKLSLTNNFLKAEGTLSFDPNFTLKSSLLTFNANFSNQKELFKIPIKGEISGKISYSEKEAALSYGGNLEVKNHKIENIEGSLNAKLNANLSGKIAQRLDIYSERLSLQSDFLFSDGLKLSNLSLSSASLSAVGDLKISKSYLIDGFVSIHLDNLSFLNNFISQNINGPLDSKITFFSENLSQMANLSLDLKDFHYNNFLGDILSLKLSIKDLFQKPLFDLDMSINGARLHKIKIDSLTLKSSSTEKSFDLALVGNFRDPLELKSNGFWNFDEKGFSLKLQSFNGSLLKSPFSLTKEASFSYGSALSVKDFEIKMPSSLLALDLFLEKNIREITITADHFPIDFLSFNPLEVNVTGFSSFKASLRQKEGSLEGSLSVNVEEMNLNSIGEKEILKTKGVVEARVENDKLLGKADLYKENERILNLNCELPLKVDSKISIDSLRSLKADLAVDLKIEDILDFFDLGNHHLEGDLKCSLRVFDTFASPRIEGNCSLQKGSYENYYSGTSLKDINFELIGNGENLTLKSFIANDEKKGKIEALGSLNLNSLKNYSYNLDLTFTKMQLIATDLVTASFDGSLKVEGDKNGSLAKGEVKVASADFSIPDKLPQTMPELEIKFLNKTPSSLKPAKKAHPLNFDINMSGENVFVTGKGVNAQLKGNVLLKGSYGNLIPEGKLELVKGTYLFSGRNFSLSEGTIVFPGKAGVMPRLSIKAELSQEGYMIFANLQGPINAPYLSFTSTPALPLSSIISILLFGKDLSGISGLQALQLATTIGALSDTTSLLESTKRSLGIDRLTVVSKTGEKSEEQVSVEVGKYVTRDLLISIKQGITEGTSNASVELNLGWGFILQLETLQEEEQAKGTLKWSRNF